MAFLSKLFKKKAADTASSKTAAKTAANAPVKSAAPRPDPESLSTSELLAFIQSEKQPDIALKALARLSQEADFVLLASTHALATVRLAAAEKVTSLAALLQLQAQIKNKDKSVLRLSKERLAVVRATEQAAQAQQERIAYLLAQARYLHKLGYHPEFSGKLHLLQQEWPTLASQADAATVSAMQQELNACATILQAHAEEAAREQNTRKEKEQAQQTQQQALEQIHRLVEQSTALNLEALAAQIKELEAQWNQAFRLSKPSAEQAKTFEQQLQTLLNLQQAMQHLQAIENDLTRWLNDNSKALAAQIKQGEAWLKTIHWPLNEKPALYQALLERMKTLREQEVQNQQMQKQQTQQIEKNLHEFAQALNQGQAKEAGKLSQHIHQSLRQVSGTQAAALKRQFQDLNQRLHEMRDWAGFATTPKKEALVVAMRELIGLGIDPELLAEKIHALQEEWKKLSGSGHDHELWEQFHQAAEQAYEPCKVHFAEKAQLRERFVSLRQALINELDQYEKNLDWSKADYKIVQKTLDAARDTFKTYGPVERVQHQRTQDSFNAVCDRIYAHLKAEYERNLAAKEALVNSATALAQSEQRQGIVEKVKTLQNQWKEIGVTPRMMDQKLWQQFRQQCDAIFASLDHARQERQHEIQSVMTQAQTLVEQALTALAQQDAQSQERVKEANAFLHSQSLPKAVFAELTKKLQDASRNEQNARQQAQWQGLIARLHARHASAEIWQAAAQQPLPEHYQAQWFEQARNLNSDNSDQAQDLCILMEILRDKPTQTADQTRRMELQVQRLAEGLGKGLSQEDEVRYLIERWLRVSCSAELNSRFIQALQ